ncbi:MAG: M48 family metalloprotease [Pseudomonadota bacterium]
MKLLLAAALLSATQLPGSTDTRPISAADKALGAKAHPGLLAQYGGAYAGPQAALVTRVTRKVAVQSGLSGDGGDFTVTLLDSPLDNAFAVPGGYVYITRQLLALMNSEAELAAVMGHEVGHVAARHAASRSKRAGIGQLLAAGVGVLTGSNLLGGVASYGTQLYTLKFGRDQEYAADTLGVRYSNAAGYSPYGMADMLTALGSDSALEAELAGSANSVPTWMSTHPNDAARVDRATKLAEATGRSAPAAQDVAYLRALDGLPYDGPIKGAKKQLPDTLSRKVLRIGTVASGDTVATLAARMAYPRAQRERFLVLNGLDDDAVLTPGMLVKIVAAR